MDAHEPRAVNEGVFEMPVWPLVTGPNEESGETESTMGIDELFRSQGENQQVNRDLNQSPTSEAEEKIFYTPLGSPMEKHSEEKEVLSPPQSIAQARLSHGDKMLDLRPQEPLEFMDHGKEVLLQPPPASLQRTVSQVWKAQPTLRRDSRPNAVSPIGSPPLSSVSPTITPVASPIPEADRSRSRIRTKLNEFRNRRAHLA